jgi:flagellar hook-length control protein FliK
LGSLRLELQIEQGALTARLEVETAAARDTLVDNLAALKQRLAEQNIRVERFDVDLTDRRGSGPNQQPGQQGPFQQGEHAWRRPAPHTAAATQGPAQAAAAIVSSTSSDGSLDVII